MSFWGAGGWGSRWQKPVCAPRRSRSRWSCWAPWPGRRSQKEQRIWLASQVGVYRAGRGKVDVLLQVLWKWLRNNACRSQFSESISVHPGQKGRRQSQKICRSISFYFITARFVNWKSSLRNVTQFLSGINKFDFFLYSKWLFFKISWDFSLYTTTVKLNTHLLG